MTDVVVVTGIGGMGLACARRLGPGRHLVLADVDPDKLDRDAAALTLDGFDVTPHVTDVSDRASVDGLAAAAAALGPLRTLVHTAGLGPAQGSSERILAVDMLGTDHVLHAFLPHVVEGTVAVCISSMAGHLAGLTPEQERRLAAAATDELLALVGPADELPFGGAYTIAKRVNQLQVERFSGIWGERGGRVVSVSPGIISTPMGRQELEEGSTEVMQGILAISGVKRIGTAEDIAAAVDWLASPSASFVTGCDLRVDGGMTAGVRTMGGVEQVAATGA